MQNYAKLYKKFIANYAILGFIIHRFMVFKALLCIFIANEMLHYAKFCKIVHFYTRQLLQIMQFKALLYTALWFSRPYYAFL